MQIIANQVRTPDGTLLRSNSRNDFQEHVDANGEYYFVDGGRDYLRRSINTIPADDCTVTLESPWQDIRENFRWGSYGKGGNQPLKWLVLKDMTSDHIEAILETQKHIPEWMREMIFKRELQYRSHNDLHIRESLSKNN